MLFNDYHLEIGSGLGSMEGSVWHIGLMGYASNTRNVLLCLNALDDVLSRVNASIQRGVAVSAAYKVLAG